MNLKPSHLFPALGAVVVLSALSGTASAAGCAEFKPFIEKNKAKVEQALLQHYGDSERKIKLGHNNGDYDFMTISAVTIKSIDTNCFADVTLTAQKNKLVNPPPSQKLEKRGGSVTVEISFNGSHGEKACVSNTKLLSANWSHEGRVKEKIFVKNHKSKRYFSGCLF